MPGITRRLRVVSMTDQRRYTSEANPELYLTVDDVDGEKIGAGGTDDVTVEVRHKQEGVRFEATVDDDGYLRGEHGRYLPVDYYATATTPATH